MKHLTIIIIIAGILLNSSCTTLKRYDTIQPPGTDNNLADIDLFGFRMAKASPATGIKTLWDLSADAQSQFIKILNSRYPDNERFINAMSYEYIKPNTIQIPGDYVNQDLRMIFSVSKRRGFGERNSPPGYNLSSADRIEYLKISLKIPDRSGVRFTGWNMFTTEYGSIEIADVSFSRSIEVNTSGLLSADGKVTAGELSAGGKSSSGRREDQGIQYRYLRLNGRMNNDRIEMEEEGTREIDLTGNIVADVTVEFDKFPEMVTEISGLKDSTGRFNAPERLFMINSQTLIPRVENLKDTIFADLRMDYVFRNVLRGQKTFPEWDDKVKYVRGSVSKRIPLLTSGDYVPDFYCIGTNAPSGDRDVLKISAPDDKEYAVVFKTRNEADSYYEWLTNYFNNAMNSGKPLKIGSFLLKYMDNDLTNKYFGANPDLVVVPYYD